MAGLIKAGMSGMADAPPSQEELQARKLSLIGDYGRNIATAAGLGETLQTLALYGVDLGELKTYPDKVNAVTPADPSRPPPATP